jgi:tetratricopeptide (TPR) repeat protein
MELTDKDIEKIEAYWQEQLPETERVAFETRLESDAVFRQEADKIHLLTEGLDVLKKRQMRQRLKDLDATLPPIDPPNAINWLKIGIVALALALAAFGVWYFMIREEKPKISGPIAAVFEPYPALGITMGDAQNERRKDAMVLYAQKEYVKAIPKLNDSFKETQDSMLLFYKGISHLALGQSTEAQTIFEQLQNTETVPQEAAQWYLTLSYTASKQYDKAIILLKNNTSDKYKDKAQKLLDEISKKE